MHQPTTSPFPTTPTRGLRRAASLTTMVLGATAMAAAPALVASAPAAAQQSDGSQSDGRAEPARVSGEDRYATAARVATLDHDRADRVLLATGTDFADALAASALAGLHDAPVLLTRPGELPQPTLDAMQQLDTARVTILGGPAAVSAAVEADLRQRGYEVDRIRGADRYATAADLARAVQGARDNGANFPGDRRAVFLANGERFPDALSASPLSATSPAPVPMLLTEREHLPQATRDVLEELQVEAVFVVGGSAAVDPSVQQQLEQMGIDTERIAGEDRTATAVELAEFAVEFLGFDLDHVVLARGDDFPDALAAGPFAGGDRSPVLLTPGPGEIGPHTASKLERTCDTVEVVRAVGGQDAIEPSTLQQAVDAANACAADQPEDGQAFGVAPMQQLTPAPGEAVEFSVMREDEGAVTSTVDLTMVPCSESDVLGSDDDRFDDSDGDGHADGIGGSDTGAVEIESVNGRAMAEGTTYVAGAAPDAEGRITFTMRADAEDCATALVLDDEDGDRAFDVVGSRPAERYGVGQADWRA